MIKRILPILAILWMACACFPIKSTMPATEIPITTPISTENVTVTAAETAASISGELTISPALSKTMPPDAINASQTPIATLPVYFEKSAQTFESIPTWNIGLADLDGDADLDAVFANSLTNYSQVWLNDGGESFSDSNQQLGKYGHGVDLGDVDGDGDPDVVITTHEFVPTRVFLNDGKAVFQELEGTFKATIEHSVDL